MSQGQWGWVEEGHPAQSLTGTWFLTDLVTGLVYTDATSLTALLTSGTDGVARALVVCTNASLDPVCLAHPQPRPDNDPSRVTTSTPVIPRGSPFTVNWSTPLAESSGTNWVGVYPAGTTGALPTTPGVGTTAWAWAPGTGGSHTWVGPDTAGWPVGTYQIYYMSSGNLELNGPLTVRVA